MYRGKNKHTLPNPYLSYQSTGSQLRVILPHRGHVEMSADASGLHAGMRALLISTGGRSGMLLNTLQWTAPQWTMLAQNMDSDKSDVARPKVSSSVTHITLQFFCYLRHSNKNKNFCSICFVLGPLPTHLILTTCLWNT